MPRFEFKLPDIGEGVSEGEIVGWLVHVGDSINENQDMVEVMTDKATVTIGAPKAGKVLELRGAEGDTIPVGTVLVVLDVAGDSAPAAARPAAKPAEKKVAGTVASAVGDLKDVLPGMPRSPRIVEEEPEVVNDKPLASPATRKFAREAGIDLRRVRATGDGGGRVTRAKTSKSTRNRKMAAPRRHPRAACTTRSPSDRSRAKRTAKTP